MQKSRETGRDILMNFSTPATSPWFPLFCFYHRVSSPRKSPSHTFQDLESPSPLSSYYCASFPALAFLVVGDVLCIHWVQRSFRSESTPSLRAYHGYRIRHTEVPHVLMILCPKLPVCPPWHSQIPVVVVHCAPPVRGSRHYHICGPKNLNFFFLPHVIGNFQELRASNLWTWWFLSFFSDPARL